MNTSTSTSNTKDVQRESALVTRIAAGDLGALAELYYCYKGTLAEATATAPLQSSHAENLVLDLFLELWDHVRSDHLPSVLQGSSVRCWLSHQLAPHLAGPVEYDGSHGSGP